MVLPSSETCSIRLFCLAPTRLSRLEPGRRAGYMHRASPAKTKKRTKRRVEEREERMKIVVDYDLCEANALCMEAAPEVFRVVEDDTLTVLISEPGEELRHKVEEAARLCPRQAITLS